MVITVQAANVAERMADWQWGLYLGTDYEGNKVKHHAFPGNILVQILLRER